MSTVAPPARTGRTGRTDLVGGEGDGQALPLAAFSQIEGERCSGVNTRIDARVRVFEHHDLAVHAAFRVPHHLCQLGTGGHQGGGRRLDFVVSSGSSQEFIVRAWACTPGTSVSLRCCSVVMVGRATE